MLNAHTSLNCQKLPVLEPGEEILRLGREIRLVRHDSLVQRRYCDGHHRRAETLQNLGGQNHCLEENKYYNYMFQEKLIVSANYS